MCFLNIRERLLLHDLTVRIMIMDIFTNPSRNSKTSEGFWWYLVRTSCHWILFHLKWNTNKTRCPFRPLYLTIIHGQEHHALKTTPQYSSEDHSTSRPWGPLHLNMKLYKNFTKRIDTPHYVTEGHAIWPRKLVQILRHSWPVHIVPLNAMTLNHNLKNMNKGRYKKLSFNFLFLHLTKLRLNKHFLLLQTK
jgi:hypothetical protein